MRCLFFSLPCIFLLSCASDYHLLKSIEVNAECARKIAPRNIHTSWYKAGIDVTGKHFSGLLLIKNMPDSSIRVVFTTEAGMTWFDFGFSNDCHFTVYTIIKKLNRSPVIQTLRKDFELILGIPFRKASFQSWMAGDQVYFGVTQKNETAYFITNKDCGSLQSLEWGTKRKRGVTVLIGGSGYPSPEKLDIIHHRFALQIRLSHFEKE